MNDSNGSKTSFNVSSLNVKCNATYFSGITSRLHNSIALLYCMQSYLNVIPKLMEKVPANVISLDYYSNHSSGLFSHSADYYPNIPDWMLWSGDQTLLVRQSADSLESIPNQSRGVAVLLQCTALEQNFGMVSTVAEVLRSKITAPEQIFGMVSSVCVAIVLHFTALEQNYMAEDQFFWNDVNNCKLLLSKIQEQCV